MSECQWDENVNDLTADHLCVTHGCFTLGVAFDDDVCNVARLTAEVAALRARINEALALLASAIKYERNLGDHMTLTQISEVLDGQHE